MTWWLFILITLIFLIRPLVGGILYAIVWFATPGSMRDHAPIARSRWWKWAFFWPFFS